MNRLARIEIKGYKSLHHTVLDLGAISVLIGPNGAGKSNFVSFFKLLNFMMTEQLQLFVSKAGFASSLLYYGADETPQIQARLIMETTAGKNTYEMRLVHAAGDTLIFAEEAVSFVREGNARPPVRFAFEPGRRESSLVREEDDNETRRVIRSLLQKYRYFQFHDTSEEAKIRQHSYINDCSHLKSNAGNLAAVLYALRQRRPAYYRRVVETIQMVVPFFADFVLDPNSQNRDYIILNWRDRRSELLFGPHQLSDGTLRLMALVTLLMQPEESLPDVIIIDEPELGLHPYAIDVLAPLVRNASTHSQIVLATQSVSLVEHFEPEEIVICERQAGGTVFKRRTTEELQDWLTDYSSIGELWEKGVLGGRFAT